ncbi:MAG: HK97 family phage prohead protease [Clostridiales bacterium]|nr:HK97 family phage prohead protease [Clostridiales bacterium]
MSYDFSGWATRNNLRCTDGRVILQDAFADSNGMTVPLMWNHKHGEISNVLGHALLANRPEGVYCYGVFNDSPEGRDAKERVRNGDITSLSIYANGLEHVNGRNVKHGTIREVSLVLAGANPGAYIDDVICHSDGDEGAIITTGMDFEEVIYHGEGDYYEEDQNDYIMDSEEVKEMAHAYTGSITSAFEEILAHNQSEEQEELPTMDFSDYTYEEEMEHADGKDKTVQDVFNSLTEEQKNVVYALIGVAVEDAVKEKEGEDAKMTHNVFESQGDYIAHAQMEAGTMFKEALADLKNYGSLKESVLAHGVEDIDLLFPEPKALNDDIDFVTRNTDWVKVFMDRTHKSAFARTKSLYGDLTTDDARARGYIKGRFKKEQIFSLLKRTTEPTTVYKKQKVEKDDLIDISGGNYDLITILNKEMRTQLDEEIARAALVGDGRPTSSDDKIDPLKIRPIWTDEDFFTIKYTLPDESPRAFIEGAVRARVDYKGSGNPTLFITEQSLTELLLLTDSTGRDLYDSVEKLATKLRVRDIVTVPVMENLVRVDTKTGKAYKLHGIIVNLGDYNIGTDRGGQIKWYDQFDIDYNAQKYLIETRCSGALIKPFSAIVLETETTAPEAEEESNG